MSNVLIEAQVTGELTAEQEALLAPFVAQWFPNGGILKDLKIYRNNGKLYYSANGFSIKSLLTITRETTIVGTVDETGVAHPFE